MCRLAFESRAEKSWRLFLIVVRNKSSYIPATDQIIICMYRRRRRVAGNIFSISFQSNWKYCACRGTFLIHSAAVGDVISPRSECECWHVQYYLDRTRTHNIIYCGGCPARIKISKKILKDYQTVFIFILYDSRDYIQTIICINLWNINVLVQILKETCISLLLLLCRA